MDASTNLANLAEAGLLFLLFLIASALGMLPTTRALVLLWTSDPLRSFGALIPLVTIALLVRAWRNTGWTFAPAPVGLVAIVVAVAASRTSEGLLLTYHRGSVGFDPFQPGLLLFLYFSGVVLLLGGRSLWRASLFPLCLLLCVNPVPHMFSVLVDYPLQRISADVARHFAHLLGLYPTGAQLQLMFTPKFGMEIIPGCNGMRGAATMAYVTLLLGYLRGYRPPRIALLVVCATLLGYLLNFTRLCLLVFYYAIGRNHPALRGDGVLIDYIIGGCLFLLLSTLVGALWFGGQPDAPQQPQERAVDWPRLLRQPLLLTSAALLAAASLTELPAAYAVMSKPSGILAPATAFAAMPPQAGPWQRSSGFTREVLDGTPRWVWADYRNPDGRIVGFGIWLMPTQHYAIRSRQAHGVEPDWQGGMNGTAAGNIPVRLSSFIVRDDLETVARGPGYFAETTCLDDRCVDRSGGFNKQGWSVALGPSALRTQLRLPVQFRVEHPAGSTTVSDAQRAQDETAIRDLLSHIDTRSLTLQLGFR